ncbi:MAG: SDR family oxidoreductase [Lewinella sp.]|nr:SDR family oxidoreductase [Lewinella sp.]
MHTETVLITGGCSGLGRELARHFARAGARLILVSEDADRLSQTATNLRTEFDGLEVLTFHQDLTQPEAPQRVWAFTEEQARPVDVLVNNAGFGTFGYFTEIDAGREAAMIQLNVLALHQLTRLYLPRMVAANAGGVINISSISAYQPVPTMATYGATKAFVLQLTRAIRAELREQGCTIPVLAVCPTGIRDTPFKEAAGMSRNPLFKNWMSVTVEKVAFDAYRSFRHNEEFVIPVRRLHYLNSLVRRLPSRWVMYFARQTLKQ